ncbi:MAG: XRE family transcriptional regulator [Sandaracinaceae bacterium]
MDLPAFQGIRLKEARTAREMTAASVAQRVGVTGPSVTNWEKGRAQPRAQARTALSRVLELPEHYFLRPPSETAPESFRFRSLSAATKRARRAAEVKGRWLHEVVEFLGTELELPSVNLPDLDLPHDPNKLTSEDIEKAAADTRAHWGLRDGPIPNVTRLLEANGIVVARFALNAAELSGLSSLSTEGRPYVILNIEKASCVRSRFDAAHELGHLILHRTATPKPESALHKKMELQAHRFAGAFIFPLSAVKDEVCSYSLDSLVELKRRWKLSLGAQVYRLLNAGIIGTREQRNLHRQIGLRQWRTWEPLDDELPRESPTLLSAARTNSSVRRRACLPSRYSGRFRWPPTTTSFLLDCQPDGWRARSQLASSCDFDQSPGSRFPWRTNGPQR